MKEVDFDIDEWIESSEDNDWVIRTLKIWFIFQKDYQKLAWCNWPLIEDDGMFW